MTRRLDEVSGVATHRSTSIFLPLLFFFPPIFKRFNRAFRIRDIIMGMGNIYLWGIFMAGRRV